MHFLHIVRTSDIMLVIQARAYNVVDDWITRLEFVAWYLQETS